MQLLLVVFYLQYVCLFPKFYAFVSGGRGMLQDICR